MGLRALRLVNAVVVISAAAIPLIAAGPVAAQGGADCLSKLPTPAAGIAAVYDNHKELGYLFGGASFKDETSGKSVPTILSTVTKLQVFRDPRVGQDLLTHTIPCATDHGTPGGNAFAFASAVWVPDGLDGPGQDPWDNRAYVFGGLKCWSGSCDPNPSPAISAYTPTAATQWQQEVASFPDIVGPNFPRGRHGGRYGTSAVFVPAQNPAVPLSFENKAYVFGGIDATSSYLDHIVVFDPKFRTVKLLGETGFPKIIHTSAVYAPLTSECPEGCIYIFGGYKQIAANKEYDNGILRFDLQTGQVTRSLIALLTSRLGTSAVWVPEKPNQLCGPCMAPNKEEPKQDYYSKKFLCLEGCAYVFGGRSAATSGAPATSWQQALRFDPSADPSNQDRASTWPVPKGELKPPRWGTAALWIPWLENVIVLGGATVGVDPASDECYAKPRECFSDQIHPMVPDGYIRGTSLLAGVPPTSTST